MSLGQCMMKKDLTFILTIGVRVNKNCHQCTPNRKKEVLDYLSDTVPFLFQCDNFVNQYTPEIVKLLLQEVGPNAVCAVLRLCTASMNILQRSVTSVKGLCMSSHT